MKPPSLKFDFPDLESPHALLRLTDELYRDAYYIEGGRAVGIRNMELSARYIDLRRQALVGIAREWVATMRKSQAIGPTDIKTADAEQRAAAKQKSHRR